MRRRFAAPCLAAGVAVACGQTASRPSTPAPHPLVVHPADPTLAALDPRDTTYVLRVLMRSPSGDTTERERTQLQRGEHDLAGGNFLLTSKWAPPFTTDDSLIVRRAGLVPIQEHLLAGGVRRWFRYEGRRITGTVQHPDSAPRRFDRTFPEVPFAFNEVEALVRSVPLRTGFEAVVPLFSEIDETIEHDTIAVLGPDSLPGIWRVRFADPVIVSVYEIDGSERRTRGYQVIQRRSGLRIRYVPPTGS